MEECGKYGHVRLVGFVGDVRPLSEYTSLNKTRNAESCKELKSDNIVDITTQPIGKMEIKYTERG